MAGSWVAVLAGVAAMGAVAGCQRHGVLDPNEPPGKLDGGAIAGGGVPTGAAPGSGGGAPTPDAGRADGPAPIDAGNAPDARPATDAGVTDAGGPEGGTTIVTMPPTSACALGSGLRPAPPPNPVTIPGCSAGLRVSGVMKVGPARAGQSYRRCQTLGPETGWRVTLSPDGGHLAAQTSAGTVRIYRTDLWREVAQVAAPVGSIDAVAFSPDGAWLAGLASEMGRLTIWNVLDGVAAETYDAPPAGTLGYPSSAVAFSSDGRRVATSLGNMIDRQTGTMTSLFTGQPVGPSDATLNPTHRTDLFAGNTYSMRFVGCDQMLLVDGAYEGGMVGWIESVMLVGAANGSGTGLAGGLYADIRGVVSSPDSRWVAFARADSSYRGLYLYDAAGGRSVAFDAGAVVRFVAGFSRAGDRLYVVTDTAIEARQVPSLNVVRRIALTAGTVPTGATVSSRDQVILSTDHDSTWFDPSTGIAVRNLRYPIAGVQYSADGRFGVASGDGAALFHLWGEDDPTVSCSPPASPPDAAVVGFAVSQDARTLAMVDAAGVVQVRPVDPVTGAVYAPSASVETGVEPFVQNISVAVANGGGRVAVQGRVPTTSNYANTSRLVVADTADGTFRIFRDVPRNPGPIAISPDGAWVAFQDGEYTGPAKAVAVSVASGATAVSVPYGPIDSFSPDSKQIAIASAGGMQVWDLATGVQATTYSIGGSTISRQALSPDWSLLGGVVSAVPYSSDKVAAQVWHPQDGSIVIPMGKETDLTVPPRFDTANTIVATFPFETHTLGTSWSAWHVWSLADGTELRTFPLSSATIEPLVILPGATRLLTRAGTTVAMWCR